jgi:hypothetical protein
VHEIPINWLAVAAAALVKFLLGWLWYSPFAFGRQWQAATGCSPEDMRKALPRAIPADLVLSFIMAFVLLHAVYYAGAKTWALGAIVGVLNWLGFIVAVSLPQHLYEKRPMRLFILNNAYLLIALAIMGAILAVWT